MKLSSTYNVSRLLEFTFSTHFRKRCMYTEAVALKFVWSAESLLYWWSFCWLSLTEKESAIFAVIWLVCSTLVYVPVSVCSDAETYSVLVQCLFLNIQDNMLVMANCFSVSRIPSRNTSRKRLLPGTVGHWRLIQSPKQQIHILPSSTWSVYWPACFVWRFKWLSCWIINRYM